MCGISAFIAKSTLPASFLKEMTSIISHRGPDDEGYIFSKGHTERLSICGGDSTNKDSYKISTRFAPSHNIEKVVDSRFKVGLGHRRLSIIDLSPMGHQPMCTSDGRYWISYNGEIYNHDELKEKLSSLGHQFVSQTDTEIILAAYSSWGKECLHMFNGMWAFIIYDIKREEIFLANDRFGIKPIYYWVAPDGSVFIASEIKQFTRIPSWKANLNTERAYDYLVWKKSNHTDETLFNSVYQFRPGQMIRMSIHDINNTPDGRLPMKNWYKLKPAKFSGSFNEASTQFYAHLKESIQLRLRADVPVGSCLSGGLDSSSIVCIIHELLENDKKQNLQNTFSACSGIKGFDEREWIDEVVRHTSVNAHYTYPTLQGLFQNLDVITWHQDEPFGSASTNAQWNVFRLAAENGVKVMLDGQGADEQLAGYHSFFAPQFAGLLQSGHWIKLWKEIKYVKKLHGYSELRAFTLVADMLFPQFIKLPMRELMGKTHKNPSWIDNDLLDIDLQKSRAVHNRKFNSIQSKSYDALVQSSLQSLLHWEDRNSMAHSVEARVPFLDHNLVEFVLGLPDEYKLENGMTKRVLRSGMNGILPERICSRIDKQGFITPEEHWAIEKASGEFRERLEKTIEISGGIIKPEAMKHFESMIQGNRPYNSLIWRLINFGEWMDVFSVAR